MASGYEYNSLDFTETFLETYASEAFDEKERRLFRKALRLLDHDEKHPSLRVHKLHGRSGRMVRISVGGAQDDVRAARGRSETHADLQPPLRRLAWPHSPAVRCERG